MPGELDEQYIRARAALLDAAEALAPHLNSIILVGAQAIYLHTGGAADLVVAEFTTDADFSVEPALLSDEPLLTELLEAHGFTPREHPGGWRTAAGVYVDIMVPEALAGRGTRGADLGAHGRRVARRALGLEGARVDRELLTIASLDAADDRSVTMNVAGPGALIVAKAHKIWERTTNDERRPSARQGRARRLPTAPSHPDRRPRSTTRPPPRLARGGRSDSRGDRSPPAPLRGQIWRGHRAGGSGNEGDYRPRGADPDPHHVDRRPHQRAVTEHR